MWNSIKKDEGLECAGLCKNIYHLKCMGVSPRNIKILKGIEGCRWFCSTCRLYVNFLDRYSKDFNDFKESVLSELNKIMERTSNLNIKKDGANPGLS